MPYGTTNALATWMRATAYLLDPVPVAAEHECDREAALESCVQVRVTGTPIGTVTVYGTVDGQPDEQVLSWNGSGGFRLTTKRFTGHVRFVTDLVGGDTIEAKAVGVGGEAHVALQRVRGPGHPVTVMPALSSGRPAAPGAEDDQTHKILVGYEETWRPMREDRVLLELTGEVLQVVSVRSDPSAMHGAPWLCGAKKMEGLRSE